MKKWGTERILRNGWQLKEIDGEVDRLEDIKEPGVYDVRYRIFPVRVDRIENPDELKKMKDRGLVIRDNLVFKSEGIFVETGETEESRIASTDIGKTASITDPAGGMASAAGDKAMAFTKGKRSVAAANGLDGVAYTIGTESISATTGTEGISFCKNDGVAIAIGNHGAAYCNNADGCAMLWGWAAFSGCAGGVLGSKLIFATDDDGVKVFVVDGKNVKEKTFYKYEDGMLQETELREEQNEIFESLTKKYL